MKNSWLIANPSEALVTTMSHRSKCTGWHLAIRVLHFLANVLLMFCLWQTYWSEDSSVKHGLVQLPGIRADDWPMCRWISTHDWNSGSWSVQHSTRTRYISGGIFVGEPRGFTRRHCFFSSFKKKFLPLDEAIASRTVFVVVSRAGVRTYGNAFGTS